MAPALLLLALLSQDADARCAARVTELSSGGPAERRAAAGALLAMGADAVPGLLRALAGEAPGLDARVDALVARLSRPDWREREAALRDLADLGSAAVERLRTHREAPDPEVRWRVLSALAVIDERRPQEHLRNGRRDAMICDLLGEIGDPRAVAPLLALIDDDSRPEVMVRSVAALAQARARLDDAQAEAVSEAALRVLAETTEPRDRISMVRAAGRCGSPIAVRPLASLVEDGSLRDVHLKEEAMRALARIGGGPALAAVVRTLGSESAWLRESAAASLAMLGAPVAGLDPRAPDPAIVQAAQAWWSKTCGAPWTD